MSNKLSTKMQEALDYATKHGRLYRYKGGFWSHRGMDEDHFRGVAYGVPVKEFWFTTNTISALCSRGYLEDTGVGVVSIPPGGKP